MWCIGDIVESRVTGEKIQITRLSDSFVIGKLIGFVVSDKPTKLYNGTKILSHKNISK